MVKNNIKTNEFHILLQNKNNSQTKTDFWRRKKLKQKVEEKNNQISLHQLEKSFMQLQKSTIETYLQGKPVDQNIINKDFMTYTLDNFHDKAREKAQIKKKIQNLMDREKSQTGKKFSFLNRPNTATDRMRIIAPRPNSAMHSSMNFMVEKPLKKAENIHYLSVKQQKKQSKIEANQKTIEKIQENINSDLEGLGEVEIKALGKLRRKFVLYNNTNYEVLENNQKLFLNRNMDLKTKEFLVFDPKKYKTAHNTNKNTLKPTIENLKSQYYTMKQPKIHFDNRKNILEEKRKFKEKSEKEIETAEIKKKIEKEEEEKKNSEKEEKHLSQLKEFKKKFEFQTLNEEEITFFENIKKNEYNSIRFKLMEKQYLVNITDKVD